MSHNNNKNTDLIIWLPDRKTKIIKRFNKNNPTNKWTREEKLEFADLEDSFLDDFAKLSESKFEQNTVQHSIHTKS